MSKNKAFTLIEIILVVVIVGIVSGFVFFNLSSNVEAAKDTTRRNAVSTLKTAILATNEGGYFPVQATQCEIGNDCTNLQTALVPEFYSSVESIPKDPSGIYYTYQTTEDGTDFAIEAELSTGYVYQYEYSSGFSEYMPIPSGVERVANGGFETGALTSWTEDFSSGSGTACAIAFVDSDYAWDGEGCYCDNGFYEGIKRTGDYGLYFTSCNVEGGEGVHSLSQTMDLSGVSTLNFWYKFFSSFEGTQTGEAIFRVRINDDLIWETETITNEVWTQANVNIPSQYATSGSVVEMEAYSSCVECGACARVCLDDITAITD